jgi:hypothetical protein
MRTEPRQISIELKGQTYYGSYFKEDGMVIVSTRWRENSAEIRGSPLELLAKRFLSEMVMKYSNK